MRAKLIFNQKAGGAEDVSPEALLDALRRAGYDPTYAPTEQESDLDEILDGALDEEQALVVAAGGDGTLRAVAARLVGRNALLALVPMGTANNIGRTLGIEGKPLEIAEQLGTPQKLAFDVGRLVAPWGGRYFLEGMGFGFFADTLALYDPEEGKSILRGISTFTATLRNYRSYSSRLTLDGRDISGDYIMVEVLNTKTVGPRLKLAPDADPQDGLLEIIAVRGDERENFLRYVTSLLAEDFDELPSVESFSGRRLEIEWQGFPIHVDAEVLPEGVQWAPGGDPVDDSPYLQHVGATVTAEVLPHALELWLPR